MKITIDQAALKAALGPVERATAKGPTPLMVLKNVLFHARESEIRISGTDEITSVSVPVAGEILQPGAVTVEADILAALVTTLPPGPITISQLGDLTVRLECAGGTSKLRAIPAVDFPELPTIVGTTPVVTMHAEYLSRLIERVAVSAAKEQSRPVLAGVHLKVLDGYLHLWAADGFRASAQRVKLEDPATPASATTVPAPAMRQLAKILATTGGDVTLGVTDRGSHLVADAGGTVWTAKIIDGTFPDMLRILPDDFATTVTVRRDALLLPVRRAQLITRGAGEKLKDVVDLSVRVGEDDLTPGAIDVAAHDLSGSETLASVDSTVAGESMDLIVNGPYLVDALGAFDGADVVIGLNGPTKHMYFRTPGSDDHTQVVVPMVRTAL